MRDIKRIEPFLKKGQEWWEHNPDLRFGQVIYIFAEQIGRDIFFPEEDEWEHAILKAGSVLYNHKITQMKVPSDEKI